MSDGTKGGRLGGLWNGIIGVNLRKVVELVGNSIVPI